jgi:hypothetical protein
MKIIPGKYKEERNWQPWLKFKYPHGSKLSLVFLWRLAALARDFRQIMDGLLGYRDVQETKRLYEADKALHGGVPSGKVATPGTSWHECNLAVDMDGSFWETTSKSLWLCKDRLHQQLNLYGLMLPLNTVDSPSVLEWWHLQPIETNGIPGAKRAAFLDKDDLIYGDDNMIDLRLFQDAAQEIGVYKGVIDGKNGPMTKAAAQEFLLIIQQILGLPDVQKLQKQIDQINKILKGE